MPATHRPLRRAVQEPKWLTRQPVACSTLAAQEDLRSSAGLRWRIACQAMAAAVLAIALTLAGVAALLWAALPEASLRQPWLLLGVPALPLMLALVLWGFGRTAALSAARSLFTA